VAGPLSQRGAQLLRGALARGDESRIATQPLHQPLGADPAGPHVARKMHAAHHALAREPGGALQQLRPARGHHFGQ